MFSYLKWNLKNELMEAFLQVMYWHLEDKLENCFDTDNHKSCENQCIKFQSQTREGFYLWNVLTNIEYYYSFWEMFKNYYNLLNSLHTLIWDKREYTVEWSYQLATFIHLNTIMKCTNLLHKLHKYMVNITVLWLNCIYPITFFLLHFLSLFHLIK